MTHVDHFYDYLTNQQLTQAQREAIIRLVVVIMYADKRLTLDENQVLTAYEQALAWTSDITLRQFFAKTAIDVRKAMHDTARHDQLIADVCAALKANAAQAVAIKACNDMAHADAVKSAEERAVLQKIVQALGA